MQYFSKTDHRDQSVPKSQWTVTFAEEQGCFKNATAAGWNGGNTTRWGLHTISSAKPAFLGLSARAYGTSRQLFIAKFVDSDANDSWHGYPADPYRLHQDIPPSMILNVWQRLAYLRPALVRKLGKGQRCSL